MTHAEGLIVELSGEPDEDPPQYHASLHPLHQTQPRLQTNDVPQGGGRYSTHFSTKPLRNNVLRDECVQVITQLKACGIVETIIISAAGFPIRY